MKYIQILFRLSCFTFILISAFFIGRGMAEHFTLPLASTVEVSTEGNWGLSFPPEGGEPAANATMEELSQYNACYKADTSEKKLYLTFDVGYENGNTEKILSVLQKHKIPAAFFVVGTYLDSNPEIVRKMAEQGYIVGNHTHHHKNMSEISTLESFKPELDHVEQKYRDITGKPLDKFYRPPQGIYNSDNLKMAESLGYKTVFWSLAYVDWKQDDQPSKEEAFRTLLPRTHPGAVILLHSTSSTNSEILEELILEWKKEGYSFHSLYEL